MADFNEILFEKPMTETDKTEFFLDEVLHFRLFQFSWKKDLVVKIIKKTNLLCKESIVDIRKSLDKIMDYRNAFAHNPVKYESGRGYFLKRKLLNDFYWQGVEDKFNCAHDLLREALVVLHEKTLHMRHPPS